MRRIVAYAITGLLLGLSMTLTGQAAQASAHGVDPHVVQPDSALCDWTLGVVCGKVVNGTGSSLKISDNWPATSGRIRDLASGHYSTEIFKDTDGVKSDNCPIYIYIIDEFNTGFAFASRGQWVKLPDSGSWYGVVCQ